MTIWNAQDDSIEHCCAYDFNRVRDDCIEHNGTTAQNSTGL